MAEQAVVSETAHPVRVPPLGRDFQLYAAGRIVSIAGDRIALITLVFLVIHLSKSFAPALALFYVARMLPTLLVGLLAGVIADHYDRKRLMIACDVTRAALLLIVPLVHAFDVWTVYPLVFVLYLLTLLFDTSSDSSLPDLVPEARMTTANGILNGIGRVADLFYAVGGTLIVVLGYQIPFWIDAGTFMFSAAMITLMRFPHHDRGPRPDLRGTWERIVAGFRYVGSRPFLKWSAITLSFAPFAGGVAFVLTPLYAEKTLAHTRGLAGPLHNAAFRFSLLEVSLGVGALIGSALTVRLAHRMPRGRIFGLGITGTGIAYGLLGLVTNLYAAIGIVAFVGLFNSMFAISSYTLIQLLTPSEIRGRVIAAITSATMSSLALGSAVSGVLLLIFPYAQLWVLIGVIIVVSGGFIWMRPEVREQV